MTLDTLLGIICLVLLVLVIWGSQTYQEKVLMKFYSTKAGKNYLHEKEITKRIKYLSKNKKEYISFDIYKDALK